MNSKELLQKLVEIPSAAPNERELAQFCHEFLQNAGFDSQLQTWGENRVNVIATNGNAPYLLLSAHLDTVLAFNYKNNPHQLIEENNFYRGLGIYDMKAGLAIILHSAQILNPKNMGIKIILTSDEEIDSRGTWAAYNANHYDNCQIAIVPEIIDTPKTINEQCPTHEPLPIVLGRRGRCVYQIQISTLTTHGAEGRNSGAIDIASQIALSLKQIPNPTHPKLGPSTFFVRSINSSSQALETPATATLLIDAHYTPPYTQETFLQFLQEKILQQINLPKNTQINFSIKERNAPYLKPYICDENSSPTKEFLSSINNPKIEYGMTVADENIIAQKQIPCISWAPRGGCAHQNTEWLSKTDYERLWELYPKTLQKFIDSQ